MQWVGVKDDTTTKGKEEQRRVRNDSFLRFGGLGGHEDPFPIFSFSHHDIFHKNRDRSSTKRLKKTKVYLVVMVYHVSLQVLVILFFNIWDVFDQ